MASTGKLLHYNVSLILHYFLNGYCKWTENLLYNTMEAVFSDYNAIDLEIQNKS